MAITNSIGATHNTYLDGLLSGRAWSGTLSFSFPDSATDYETGYGNGELSRGFAQVSLATQQVVRAALLGTPGIPGGTAVLQGLGVAQLTNLQIVDAGTDSADLRVAQSALPGTAYAYYPMAGVGGDVWFGSTYNYRNPVLGNYSYMTTLHELGHALGLKHSQETEGVANVAVPSDRDDIEFTIMSYRSTIGGPTTGYTFGTWDAPQSYMMLDIAALQAMYGANYATHAGDNVYRWSPTTGEMFIDGVGQGTPGGNRIFLTLWDGGGHDTFDLSNYGNGVTVSLAAGGWSEFSSAQESRLSTSKFARGNVFNALLFQGDTRSLVEDAIGGSGADTLSGNQLANHLVGGAGDDSLSGLDGNDTLEGQAGRNTLSGGTGDDSYILTSGSDVVVEYANAGTDTVYAGFTYTLGANLERLSLFGSGNLNGTGNALANMLFGNAGNNNLSGGAGDDTLVGDAGNDTLDGGTGLDCLIGGDGDDLYIVNKATTTIVELSGGGIDRVLASIGVILPNYVETLTLTGTAHLTGTGNALANSITGNAGNNSLFGGAGHDTLEGGDGNDTLQGDAGNNSLLGGAGNDTYIVASTGDTITEAANAGIDTVLASVTYTLADNVENLTLTGTAAISATGNALGNTLVGNGAANRLAGGDGADNLSGGGGNDTLDGGTGNDTMSGGTGDDTYIVDSPGDVLLETGNAGGDLVMASVSWTLATNFENLTLTGSASLSGTGNAAANILLGNAGANLLSGGAGADALLGGAGADTLLGGAGADTLTGGSGTDAFRWLAANEGGDAILDFTAVDDRLEFSAGGFGAGLVAGMSLGAGRLAIGAAVTASGTLGQFLFNTASGALTWDADGAAAGVAVLLATLFNPVGSLTAADFVIIA